MRPVSPDKAVLPKKEECQMTDQAQDAFEWVVVHGSPEEPMDAKPCSSEDCYSDREPYGEYIYWAASNPDAIKGDKIDILDYGYLAEARVSFEEDLVEEGKGDLAWCQQDADEQGEAFLKKVWPSWQDVPLSVVSSSIFPPDQDFVMAKSVLAVGDDFGAWLEVTRIEADMPAEMALTFCKVEKDRLLEIKAVLKDETVPVYVLADFWSQLVEQFRDLPYAKLSGAKRVEPEIEMLDFEDFETEGEA